MAGRSPVGPLMTEHRVIERMIAVLRSELDRMQREQRADPAFVDVAVDFIRTYADRCHHGKEEDILFARLAERDLDAELAREMQELIEDHAYARGLTRQLVDANARCAAGEAEALDDIEAMLRALVEFYPVHIAKEDRHFFKPCMTYFTDAEKATMLDDFAEFDRGLIHEKYRGVVEALERHGA